MGSADENAPASGLPTAVTPPTVEVARGDAAPAAPAVPVPTFGTALSVSDTVLSCPRPDPDTSAPAGIFDTRSVPALPSPRPPASEAPPHAPRPAMRPLPRSPPEAMVPAAVPPRASAHVGRPKAAPRAPRSVGRILPRKPASGRPVCGLMVSEPPWAMARACRPPTSSGVM